MPDGSPRRRWKTLDYALAAGLVLSLGWLGFEMYGAVASKDAAPPPPPPDHGDLCERLNGRGRVLALGRDMLPKCDVEGLSLLVPVDVTPDGGIERLLSGRDDGAVADLLAARDVRHVVVASALANPSLLPRVTVRNRLALYKPSDRFRAVYLSEAGGLYEVAPGGLEVPEAEGAGLVRVARAVLAGSGRAAADPPGPARRGEYEVAVQLQGLKPVERIEKPQPDERNRKEHVRRLRRGLFASARGGTLVEATRAAAEKLADLYARRGLDRIDGPIERAIERLTVEVEVMHDWNEVRTLVAPGTPELRYRGFLWRTFELGLHGVAVNRGTDRYRYRLPSDAIYAGRKSPEDVLERVCRDLFETDERALAEVPRPPGAAEFPAAEAAKAAYRTLPGIRVERFRSHHFREMTPGGEVRGLSRGIPPLPLTPEAVGRASLRGKVYWATRWLVENLQPDGRFRYLYRPELDYYLSDMQIVEQYNEVRHGLATYSLFMSHQEVPAPDLWDAAERSLQWILRSVVFGPAWRERLPKPADPEAPFGPPAPGGRTAPAGEWRCPHGDVRPVPPDIAYVRHLDNAKMGSVAAATLAISELIRQTPEAERPARLDEFRPFLQGFASFMLLMQHASGARAGSFDHYFVAPDHGHYQRSTTIYPGEILFALARIHGLTGDPRIPPAYAAAHRYEKAWFDRESAIRESDGTYANARRVDLVQFVPWISMAHNDMYLAVRDEDPAMAAEYADFGIAVSDWVVREYLFDEDRTFFPEYLGGYFKWEFELPAMHSMVYAEGTAAAFRLADLTGDPRRETMRRATVLGCRFAAQQIVVPGLNDQFMPNPARARGGVRFGINRSEMRTDYSYHTLSALNQALRFFDDDDLLP